MKKLIPKLLSGIDTSPKSGCTLMSTLGRFFVLLLDVTELTTVARKALTTALEMVAHLEKRTEILTETQTDAS
jgi:MinD superfamily P-loop ATPase